MPKTILTKVTREEMTIRRDGNDVVLLRDGQLVTRLPWDAALALADGIRTQARRIEEWVKADQIANDQAFILRKGLPFGLTSNPLIIGEAKREAAHNPLLRKYIPHVDVGIRSQEALGEPTLIKHRRKEDGKNIS